MQSTLVGSQPQQCATLTWLLVGDIREMLQDHLDAEAIRWLRPVLDALIDSMCEQSERTNRDGWYDDLLGSFPHMVARVASIEVEQTELCRSLRKLRHRIERDLPLERLAVEIERDLSAWVGLMMEHSHREVVLLQDVWYTEIGGEG
ncbi:MAG: hypothetical protein HQ518_28365 [Rhodopirellula sp.]|nr:hypothetical protein [Rhodopirellula sp.]